MSLININTERQEKARKIRTLIFTRPDDGKLKEEYRDQLGDHATLLETQAEIMENSWLNLQDILKHKSLCDAIHSREKTERSETDANEAQAMVDWAATLYMVENNKFDLICVNAGVCLEHDFEDNK